MVTLDRRPGLLIIRSRSVTGAQLAAFLAFGALLAALAAWGLLLGRGRWGELECSRTTGVCAERVDGAETWRVGLSEIERVVAKPVRYGRRAHFRAVLVAASGEHGVGPLRTEVGEARAEAERLQRWLAGGAADPYRVAWDLRGAYLIAWTVLTAVFLTPFGLGLLQTRCRIPTDRDRVEVSLFLRRSRRRSSLSAVRVQTGEEHVREQWRRRAGPRGDVVTPPEQRFRAMRGLRRVVLDAPACDPFPVTDWLTDRDDPRGVVAAIEAALGLPASAPKEAEARGLATTLGTRPPPADRLPLPPHVAATVPREEGILLSIDGYVVTTGRLLHWGRRPRAAAAWIGGGAALGGLGGAWFELQSSFEPPFPGLLALTFLLAGAASGLRSAAPDLRREVRWDAEAGEIGEVGAVQPAARGAGFRFTLETRRGRRVLEAATREEAERLRGAIVALRDGAAVAPSP